MEKVDLPDIRSAHLLLVVEFGAQQGIENAAMYDPAKDELRNLCLSSTMGAEDIDGVDDVTEIGEEVDGEPLVELSFLVDGGMEVGDFEGFRLVLWNHSAQRMAMLGDVVEPDGCLVLANVPAVGAGDECDPDESE